MSGIKALCDNLLDQARDKERLANGEPDSIFMLDAKVLRAAAELLKAAPEWISVKDKLPEEYQLENGVLINFLAYMPDFGVDVANYIRPAKTWLCMGIPAEVTHWMPLPQQPKKEDEL